MREFSTWYAWEERASFEGKSSPGVYCLAHFVTRPIGNADPLCKEVVYIGLTERKLLTRWRNFNRSASHKGESAKFGHSGGRCYWRAHRGGMTNLCVAAYSFDREVLRAMPNAIKELEAELISEYVTKWGRKPQFNTVTPRKKKR